MNAPKATSAVLFAAALMASALVGSAQDKPVELAEANLKSEYAPKLSKVLPAKKVARYLQIENKIRAVVKYDLASGVPPVQ